MLFSSLAAQQADPPRIDRWADVKVSDLQDNLFLPPGTVCPSTLPFAAACLDTMQTFLQPNQMPGLSRNALQLCCSSLQKPTRRQQGLGPQRSRVPCFRQQHGRRQQGLIVVAATPANAKALRAEIEELQEERELALRTGAECLTEPCSTGSTLISNA